MTSGEFRLGQAARVLYLVSFDVDRRHRDAFNRWYDEEHVPDLLECPGFEEARRYERVDGVEEPYRFLAAYEVESLHAFTTDQYRALSEQPDSKLGARVRGNRRLGFAAKYTEIGRQTERRP